MTSLRIGARVTLRVDRLSLGGDAIGRVGNAVVFVPYGAPGDTLEVELTEVRRNFCRARLVRVRDASPVRMDPPCPYHFKAMREEGREKTDLTRSPLHPHPSPLFCGGCSWQHMSYEFQVDAKRQLVQETLERIGGIRDLEVEPVLVMSDPWRYRNKVQQPVGLAPRGSGERGGMKVISGFYAPYSHDIVPIEDCLVQSELSVRLLNRTRQLLDQFHLRVYDEDRRKGWIRHLWVRTSRDDKALLVFITYSDDFPHEAAIVSELRKEFPGLVGIHQNINTSHTNVILGRHWRKCWGEYGLEERLGGLRFRLSPGSFFQVNSLQTEVLYNTVKDFAGSGDTLIDLYGGVGTIALWLAGRFRQVIGVDEIRSAVEDAGRNARLNGIQNARFIADNVDRFLSKYRIDSKNKKGLTVVLDPPRVGCSPQVLQALTRLRPPFLIYVSCDPGTLARDLAQLIRGGYRCEKVQPVDLFPQTPHIETVVSLKSHEKTQ